jgi:two-component system, sensor histidine kinase and response regulator
MRGSRVLIVDDDAALLRALPEALRLRMDGLSVETYDSATAALEQIAAHDYDAIVSDIKMPGMDGLALLAEIRALRPGTPTLLITGHGEHDLAVQALRGGAYDFVQKPIDRDYFVASLSRAIQTRQLRRQVERQQRALERHAGELERTVEERTGELQEAIQARDEFLSIASHELKTPLTSLVAHLQMLLRSLQRGQQPPIEQLERRLQAAEQASKRLVKLINGLLDVSRISAGRLELELEAVDLAEVTREVVGRFEQELAEGGCLLELGLEGAAGKAVGRWDRFRIEQVVTNLLANAIKYGPGKPIEVRVEVDGGKARLVVRDRGIGIAPEQVERIFGQFERAVSARHYGGMGLGLFIVRQIVEAHGGEIRVDSEPDAGSTFTVELPVEQSAVSNQ